MRTPRRFARLILNNLVSPFRPPPRRTRRAAPSIIARARGRQARAPETAHAAGILRRRGRCLSARERLVNSFVSQSAWKRPVGRGSSGGAARTRREGSFRSDAGNSLKSVCGRSGSAPVRTKFADAEEGSRLFLRARREHRYRTDGTSRRRLAFVIEGLRVLEIGCGLGTDGGGSRARGRLTGVI